MLRTLLTILMIATLAIVNAKDIKVIDSTDNSPLAGASVISSNGMIIGITDNEGKIKVENRDFPLTIRYMGYRSAQASAKDATISLQPEDYELPDVVISSAGRPITRVQTYMREYSTGSTPTDTLQLFNEYVVEYFLADGKVKGYSKGDAKAHVLAVRRRGRIYKSPDVDSVMQPRHEDEINLLSMMSLEAYLPGDRFKETEAIKAGAKSDTVQGKYYPKIMFRKSNGIYEREYDALADHKNHVTSPMIAKIFGLTMDIDEASKREIYKIEEGEDYGLQNYISSSTTISFLGRGKMFKRIFSVQQPIRINSYIEQYPVEITHLTVEEYKEQKEQRKDKTAGTIKVQKPESLTPLSPAVEQLIERVDRGVK